jgi:unsaturated rhamnogalacturonyl hydrolase
MPLYDHAGAPGRKPVGAPFFIRNREAEMDNKEQAGRISDDMARSVMDRYKPGDFRWHYEDGLVLQSVYKLGQYNACREYRDWVRLMLDPFVGEDGSIDTYREEDYNLDQINPGKVLFDLYLDTGADKYRKAVERLREQLRKQPRTASGGFWHKKIYPHQMWLDGLYMQGPFYARYAKEFGSAEDWNDLLSQFVLAENHTRDPRTGLLYHAWDESRKQLWANPHNGCSPHIWGRAMGWYCMALVDTLDYLPAGTDYDQWRATLTGIAVRLSRALRAAQDPDSSLWFQILDQGGRERNYLETSASAMFVYFLFKSASKDYLSPEEKAPAIEAARSGYRGLVGRKLSRDEHGTPHLDGICSVAGLGGMPYRDGSFDYYVSEPVARDDFKGVGPFILASLEAERLEAHPGKS